MSFAKTEMQVVQWGEARGIIQNGNPVGQMVKLYEEVNELFDALVKGDDDEARDAIGEQGNHEHRDQEDPQDGQEVGQVEAEHLR